MWPCVWPASLCVCPVQGLINRANRLVNWSCALRSAISNVEVDYIDLDGPTQLRVPSYDNTIEFGVIHSFAYKLADGSGKSLTDPNKEAYLSHISCRNVNRPGWCYASYYNDSDNPKRRFYDEIVALKLDGSGACERYALSRTDFTSASVSTFRPRGWTGITTSARSAISCSRLTSPAATCGSSTFAGRCKVATM